jgi:hypothetical protein
MIGRRGGARDAPWTDWCEIRVPALATSLCTHITEHGDRTRQSMAGRDGGDSVSERLAVTARDFASKLYATVLLGLASACGSKDVVLATIPGSDAGEAGEASEAAADVAPRPCASDSDCPGASCSKCPCLAPTGTCAATPAECPSDGVPVCGSDSVTYFNDCLRHKAGVSGANPLQCVGTCGGAMNVPCLKGRCGTLRGGGDSCSGDSPGSCWILPNSCSPSSGQSFWDACRAGGQHCIDACTALSAGGVYQIGSQCQQQGQ